MKPITHFYRYDGKKIAEQPTGAIDGMKGIPLSRAWLYQCLFEYAQELGVVVNFGQKVLRYFDAKDKGGVMTADGKTYYADLVVAADGVGSKSQSLVVKDPETPVSSGYALYRATFPLKHALKDSIIAQYSQNQADSISVYLGPDVHCVVGRNDAMNTMCWLLTHKDLDNESSESWSVKCSASDALKFVPESDGWTPYLRALINATPKNEAINWRLMWRSPQESWSSPKNRVIQIGDACHPYLPSSGSGAVMAMEDGYCLAACLQLSGKHHIERGVDVFYRLRFERVSCGQRMGFKTRHSWHHPNWEFIENHPQEALRIRGTWLLRHDAEKYTYENYGKCLDHILNGADFKNTNTPPGYIYQPWTVKELMEESEKNADKAISDAGDWS